MTVTFEIDLGSVKVNQQAKYLGRRSSIYNLPKVSLFRFVRKKGAVPGRTDTARGAVRRFLAVRHDCYLPLSYRIARWWRRLGLASAGRHLRKSSHGGIMLA